MRILLGIVLPLTLTTVAYGDSFMAITYDISAPVRETRDFVGTASFLGLSVAGRGFIRPNITAGVNFGWTTFHERSDRLMEIDGGHVRGNQFRQIYAVPMVATLHYYPNPNKYEDNIMHYGGIRAGP